MHNKVKKILSCLYAWQRQMILNLLKWLIRGYQIFLSPMLGNNCRFVPSCSQYYLEALQQHGIVRGNYLGIKRILKCHPWGKSGYDPVPKNSKMPCDCECHAHNSDQPDKKV